MLTLPWQTYRDITRDYPCGLTSCRFLSDCRVYMPILPLPGWTRSTDVIVAVYGRLRLRAWAAAWLCHYFQPVFGICCYAKLPPLAAVGYLADACLRYGRTTPRIACLLYCRDHYLHPTCLLWHGLLLPTFLHLLACYLVPA